MQSNSPRITFTAASPIRNPSFHAKVVIGYDQTAPKGVVTKAKARDFDSQLELDWQGYPSMMILGSDRAFQRSDHAEALGHDEDVVFEMGL